MVIHCNLSKMKNKFLPTCLQGKYRDSLGEFSNVLYYMFWAERLIRCCKGTWLIALKICIPNDI